jgi:hypothetical protein
VDYPGGRRVRRRRSRRRHRMRLLRRTVVAVALFTILLAASWIAVNRIHNSSESLAGGPSSNTSQSLAILAGPIHRSIPVKKTTQPVYNYSVVPGGVRTPGELSEAVLRDPLIAEHYAGFRFERARVVELDEPKWVYLSYRKDAHIFWTRKKHPLKAGEKVITDGSISGRTRCANRISVRKQLAVSPEPDPSMVELDQLEPPETVPPAFVTYPGQFATALLTAPGSPGDAPAGPGSPTSGSGPFFPPPFGGGGFGGGGVPGGDGGGGGGCETPAQEKHEHDLGIEDNESKEKHCPPNPKPPKPPKPPAAVPEPGTVELMLIGIVGLGLAYWKRQAALS